MYLNVLLTGREIEDDFGATLIEGAVMGCGRAEVGLGAAISPGLLSPVQRTSECLRC